jgi:hypothetical protein
MAITLFHNKNLKKPLGLDEFCHFVIIPIMLDSKFLGIFVRFISRN